jgi:hypothetical protein
VQATAKKMQASVGAEVTRHPRYREALVEAAVSSDAAVAAHMLRREIDAEARSDVRTTYGAYLLDERMIRAPRCGSDDVTGLAAPPCDAQGFVEFSDAVVRSRPIAAMLAS